MIIDDFLKYAAKKLTRPEIHNPAMESRIITSSILDISIENLILHRDRCLPKVDVANLLKAIERRSNLEPIAYITGIKEFFGRDFIVNNNVLIPRPDSEILIEAILRDYKDSTHTLEILELGVGSGCIIITIFLEMYKQIFDLVATDISVKALEIAGQNASKHNVCNIKFLQSNWFHNIYGTFDIIIANPPYIPIKEKDIMSKETLQYEPEVALFAEQNGLGAYKEIAHRAGDFLKKDGTIYLEIGYNQYQRVVEIYESMGYKLVSHFLDLNNYIRCLKFTK